MLKKAAFPFIAGTPALLGIVFDGDLLTLALVLLVEVAAFVLVSRQLARSVPPARSAGRALDLAGWFGWALASALAALLASPFPAGLGGATEGRRFVLLAAAITAASSVALVIAMAREPDAFGEDG